MKARFTYITYSFLSILLLTACNSDDIDVLETPFEQDLAELNELRLEIENFAESSICNENTSCQFTPLGNTICGTPETFIVFSTSIDINRLDGMISNFNTKQAIFIDRWGPLTNNCITPKAPIGFDCNGDACDPIF